MGWKGTLRSIQAAQRRAERDARRRQRELLWQQTELHKMSIFYQARFEVESYENLIEVLTSVHKDCGETWDWQAIAEAPAPTEPKAGSENERLARATLNAYEPSLRDKLFRRTELRRAELEADIADAQERDRREHKKEMADYEVLCQEWEMNRTIAKGILSGDGNAYVEAIRQVSPFSEIGELGSSVSFRIDDDDTSFIEATLRVNDHEALPRERKRLLKSGKLSVSEMPKTQFWALYQDYVCGAVLRVARELFALLPLDMVLVTATSEILNTQTGHLEEKPILSVAVPRETLDRFNFDLIDPSDSIGNFMHNMKFNRTRGFEPVAAISPGDIKR